MGAKATKIKGNKAKGRQSARHRVYYQSIQPQRTQASKLKRIRFNESLKRKGGKGSPRSKWRREVNRLKNARRKLRQERIRHAGRTPGVQAEGRVQGEA